MPTPKMLGFTKIRTPDPGNLNDIPLGAASRLILPGGQIQSTDVIMSSSDPTKALSWVFPAMNNLKRAIANNVLFLAEEVTEVSIKLRNESGDSQGEITITPGRSPLRIGFSNDVVVLPDDFYMNPGGPIHHDRYYGMLSQADTSGFEAPKPLGYAMFTARPFCHLALIVK